jgi:hypothetical protein
MKRIISEMVLFSLLSVLSVSLLYSKLTIKSIIIYWEGNYMEVAADEIGFKVSTDSLSTEITEYLLSRGYTILNKPYINGIGRLQIPGSGDLVKCMEDLISTDYFEDIFPNQVIYIDPPIEDNKAFRNFPNPFNPSTRIAYYVSKEGKVKLSVYDMLGKEVITLVNEDKTVGSYYAQFNGSKLSNGIYFCRLTIDPLNGGKKVIEQIKMLMVK